MPHKEGIYKDAVKNKQNPQKGSNDIADFKAVPPGTYGSDIILFDEQGTEIRRLKKKDKEYEYYWKSIEEKETSLDASERPADKQSLYRSKLEEGATI